MRIADKKRRVEIDHFFSNFILCYDVFFLLFNKFILFPILHPVFNLLPLQKVHALLMFYVSYFSF